MDYPSLGVDMGKGLGLGFLFVELISCVFVSFLPVFSFCPGLY